MGDVIRFGFVLVLAAGATVAAPGPKDPPKKPPTIVGEWAVESVEFAGRSPGPPAPGLRYVFTDDGRWLVRPPGGGAGAPSREYTLGPTADPPTIDATGGQPGALAMRGVYKVDGDRLTICLTSAEHDRPKTFESPEGSAVWRAVLTRAPKD